MAENRGRNCDAYQPSSLTGPKRHCKFCGQHCYGGKLCDFPVGDGRTCDAQMCDDCARTLGRQDAEIGGGIKRLNDTIDVCPLHREQAVVAGGKIVESPNA